MLDSSLPALIGMNNDIRIALVLKNKQKTHNTHKIFLFSMEQILRRTSSTQGKLGALELGEHYNMGGSVTPGLTLKVNMEPQALSHRSVDPIHKICVFLHHVCLI